MSLTDVMDGLAALLAGTVYSWPAEEVTVPCSVIGYPTQIQYDMTATSAIVLLPVWRVVGGDGEAARDSISDAISEAGSVKALLDGAHVWGDVRVTEAAIEQIAIGAVTYPAVRFDLEVIV
jgi:hypothetical protein